MVMTLTFQGHTLVVGDFLSSVELGAKMMWQECKFLHKKYSSFEHFELNHYYNIVGRLSSEDKILISEYVETYAGDVWDD